MVFLTGNVHLLEDHRLAAVPRFAILNKPPMDEELLKAIHKQLKHQT